MIVKQDSEMFSTTSPLRLLTRRNLVFHGLLTTLLFNRNAYPEVDSLFIIHEQMPKLSDCRISPLEASRCIILLKFNVHLCKS